MLDQPTFGCSPVFGAEAACDDDKANCALYTASKMSNYTKSTPVKQPT